MIRCRVPRSIATTVVVLLTLLGASPRAAHAIPAFARRYRTTCASCHSAIPKLNVVGEAFRQHGYRLPRFDAALARDTGLPLGDDAWRDLWPRGIWPGEIPSAAAISFRIQADVVALSRGRTPSGVHFRLPHEVYLLGGASLGDGLAAFVEVNGGPGSPLTVTQAKIGLIDPVPGVAKGTVNLWLGRLNPYLFTFADRQIDRMGVLGFAWQGYRAADLRLADAGGATLASTNVSRLGGSAPAFELNGVLGGRTYYGLGLAQGAGPTEDDNNGRKDVYLKLRHKWGGMRLDGEYDTGEGPPAGGDGQTWDRSMIAEMFAFSGEEPNAAGTPDRHQAVGANLRLLRGPLDLGVGAVARWNDDPWGRGESAVMRSLFAKGEYFVFPWLAGSLKLERFDATSDAAIAAGYARGREDRLMVAPGLVALLRQNVRLVVEGELHARDRSSVDAGLPKRAGLWTRLDVLF
jgi:hypothetical protein